MANYIMSALKIPKNIIKKIDKLNSSGAKKISRSVDLFVGRIFVDQNWIVAMESNL